MTYNESDWWYNIPICYLCFWFSCFIAVLPIAQQPISWKGLCSLFASHTLTARRKQPVTIFTQKKVGWNDEEHILYFFVGDSESFDIDIFKPQTSYTVSTVHHGSSLSGSKLSPLRRLASAAKRENKEPLFKRPKKLYVLYQVARLDMIRWSDYMIMHLYNIMYTHIYYTTNYDLLLHEYEHDMHHSKSVA